MTPSKDLACPPSNPRLRRDKVTFEEVAKACDALLQREQKVTISRVRQEVGGGGNQTVMDHVAAWRAHRRQVAQDGKFEAQLSEGFRAALVAEVQRHRDSAQAEVASRMEELQEMCEVLSQDLAAAHEQQESSSKALADSQKAQKAAEQALTEGQQLWQHRQQDAQARQASIEQRLSEQAHQLEVGRLEVAEAQFERQDLRRRAERLQVDLTQSMDAAQQAQSRAQHSAQEAAVAQAQVAGQQELAQTLKDRLLEQQAQARQQDQLARALRARLQKRRAAMVSLRRSLQRARQALQQLRATAATVTAAAVEHVDGDPAGDRQTTPNATHAMTCAPTRPKPQGGDTHATGLA